MRSIGATEGNSYDDRKRDLRSYYAQFGRRPLNDSAVWSLSLADSTLPEGHIGYRAWITYVAGIPTHCVELQRWSVGLGATASRMRPKRGQRARQYVEGYKPAWGRQASLDGLNIALFGAPAVPTLNARSEEFGVHHQTYRKVRDLVAGAVLLQMWQYEDALDWAVRTQRRAA